MATARSHGWWPYLGPYAAFLLLVEVASRAPASLEPWLFVLKVAVPGFWIFAAARGGAFPELRGYRPGLGGFVLDVLAGLAIALLWVGPYLVFPGLPRPARSEGFDAAIFGPDREVLALAVRLLGFAAVTPFMEELFVRSFLMRLVDVIDDDLDFRKVPVAHFAWRSFLVTVVWFTFSHRPWEWAVAPLAGVLFNLWLYRRRHLGATIAAHAVANGSIWLAVVLGPPELRIFL